MKLETWLFFGNLSLDLNHFMSSGPKGIDLLIGKVSLLFTNIIWFLPQDSEFAVNFLMKFTYFKIIIIIKEILF